MNSFRENILAKIPGIIRFILVCFTFLFPGAGNVQAADSTNIWKPNWLAVSDLNELQRTWKRAAVYLPAQFDLRYGRLFTNGIPKVLSQSLQKFPTIVFLHYCEGLGHHQEDLIRYAKLGFVVIAPDSFAREHRPLGCDEDQEKYNRYYDIAAAFQKAELDYTVGKIKIFKWIDPQNLYLVGSGIGGMVAAHYQGSEFTGIVIEGWGCRGPNSIFDGIWAPKHVRVFSTVSKNDPFLKGNAGFGVDCKSFLQDRKNSGAVLLDRPAHYVSWYPKSFRSLILFLTFNFDVDRNKLASDRPEIIAHSEKSIRLREKWTVEAVYLTAKNHCGIYNKRSHLISEPFNGNYEFICE